MKVEIVTVLAGGAALASAQGGAWAQCGGVGWSGATTCVSGYYCNYQNPYYSQCIPGSGGATTTKSTTTAVRTTTTTSASPVRTTTSSAVKTTTTSSTVKITTTSSIIVTTTPSRTTTATQTTAASGKFQFFGVNESGGEFGDGAIPGQLGKDYTWPAPSSIDYFVSQGFNAFRIGTKMERIAPPSTGGLTGPFNETYMAGYDSIVKYITDKGAYAIIDPHNYGRYQGSIITNTNDFKAFWVNYANRFKSNSHVIFDTNNEYHDMDQSLVFNLNQAAIDGIRSTGATQLILIEGNSYTGAWTWVSSGNAASLIALKDPLNNIAYEMHQYLDSDGSGTSPTCVSSTIFAERMQAANNWCVSNKVKCFLGELGAGTDATCQAAIRGGLNLLKANSNTWLGVTWWAAGPWWGDYYQSIEPGSGPANSVIVPLLKSYL